MPTTVFDPVFARASGLCHNNHSPVAHCAKNQVYVNSVAVMVPNSNAAAKRSHHPCGTFSLAYSATELLTWGGK